MIKKLRAMLIGLGKRKRFTIAVVTICLYFFIITSLPYDQALFHVIPLAVLTYVSVFFGILEDVERLEWIQLFILPVYFVVAALFFYYLLPVRLLTRIPFTIITFVCLYAIFLSENIFNVGVERSLPLYRAAYSVINFIMLVVFLMVFTLLYSFSFNLYMNALTGTIIVFPLVFHGMWIANPMEVVEERIWKYAAVLTFLLGFGILIGSFLPLRTNVYAILTVAMSYFLIGIAQEIIQETAYRSRVREYITVYAVLLVLITLSIQF
ncbi:hypothetical protein COU89_03520 [Candidatus Roizmanbacteria bacterium CG10_big_fil_rev_8_21_14_0_10_45_7]|uniref:Uncharacterized protein n=1 Tax=Candidatus Roizmanbacteria bacterium CG10_big_fil_rev_8_21_14_0_10_45_7 TaxID=1974854 RepID=A0A2M8KU13_9BACT|nr:MAG: hypothetical protein COU89_03520 [Candidatus Roizmanbacteria bacterium CG10_big_fil_rev_8_21_14_0_10_45_7]